MARKTATVVITAEGRDKGKVFFITEMPAMQVERWAMKAFLALARSGVEIPENISSAGLAGIAQLGLKAFGGLNFDDAEPLMQEMLACVQIIPNPSNPTVRRSDIEADIEEVSTLLKLRAEVYNLHTDFLQLGVNSKSTKTTSKQGQ
jgi:hypothetical protein